MNQARRDLGIKYKNATPQPLRDYIYEVNMRRYGDKLDPTYDYLIKVKRKSNMDKIIGISNIEIYEFCKLNLETGEKKFLMIIPGLKSLTVFILKIEKIFLLYLRQKKVRNCILRIMYIN